MQKGYFFKDKEIKTLNELGVSYSENFQDGLEDVFKNTKKVIQFIRHQNKKLAKEIISILTSCKYENSALTLIIFQLCDDKRVVINGVELSFKEFVALIKKYGPEHKAIYAFMEDLGITKTYATLNIDPNLMKDSYYIEKNIKDDFVYEYLTTYFEFDYVESLQSFISNILINEDERFRRGSKIVKNNRFELILAHKVGFKEVFVMRNESMPLFKAVELLRIEFKEEDLLKLIDDTFYWWLLDNLDKYGYKKPAKEVYVGLKRCIKEKQKLAKNFDFSNYVTLASKVYEFYLEFVMFFKQGCVYLKKKYDPEQYALDKFYCKTFICADFMKHHTVKLQKENLQVEEESHQAVELEEDVEEKFEPKNLSFSANKLKRLEKTHCKMKRMIGWSIFYLLFFTLILSVAMALGMVLNDVQFLQVEIDIVALIVLYSCCAVGMILSIVLTVQTNHSLDAVSDLGLLENSRNKDLRLSSALEQKISEIQNKEDKLQRKASSMHRILSSILAFMVGCVMSVIAIYALTLLNQMTPILSWQESYLDSNLKMLYMLAGGVLGFLYGILRKRKGALTIALVAVISIAAVVGLTFVL